MLRLVYFFFFKQKTAYDILRSDWSSDVCSSDLVATSDSGHWGAGSTDARWALENRLAEVDWGERGMRETAETAIAVIEAHYGAAPAPKIFQGCSTGGRQANMLAVKSPELFDGIINGAPALDYTGLVATWMASVVQANTAEDSEKS